MIFGRLMSELQCLFSLGEVLLHFRASRIEGQSAPVNLNGLVRSAEPEVNRSEISEGLGVAWVRLDRLFEVLRRLVKLSQVTIDNAEIICRLRVSRRDFQRLQEAAHRQIELPIGVV